MDELKSYPAIAAATAEWARRKDELTQRCIEIQQIPAPTGQEAARAEHIAQIFRAWQLSDVSVDALFNVYGRVSGGAMDEAAEKPAVLVTAHTDTVFDVDTDLRVNANAESGRLYGPGIGDNSAGVAALLALAETLTQGQKDGSLPVDIWLVANSGEEGLGDLKGMRAVVDRLAGKIGACIVIEGMGLGRIVHRALGSRRFRIHVEAPGGHSWSDFGAASAIHVLMQVGSDISRLSVPVVPRTTYNLGRVSGGTSVNSIAQYAAAELDLRSEAPHALQSLVQKVEDIVARHNTPRRQRQGVSIRLETIGDRPAGEIGPEHPLVEAAMRSLSHCSPARMPDLRISSTDANIPLSQGIPAVCIGITDGGDAHRLQEWIQTEPLSQGVQHLIRLTWWAAGWLAEMEEPE